MKKRGQKSRDTASLRLVLAHCRVTHVSHEAQLGFMATAIINYPVVLYCL